VAGQGWKVSFKAGDSFKERQRAHGGAHSTFREAVATARPLPPPSAPAPPSARRNPVPALTPPDDDCCSRGDWCSGRVITIENGARTVTPAATPRAYCHACEGYIGLCLDGDPADGHYNGMPALYRRLHRELGEARQSEVMVKVPFGPSVPLSEAIDAQMRLMGEILCSWEERVRDIDSLSDLGEAGDRPQDDAADIERSVTILAPRISILVSLAPQEMMRSLPPWLVTDEDADCEIMSCNGHTVTIMPRLDGRRAGQEIMHLHYMARRLLLETNPPMPLLPDFRCRVCERKLLRKAPPPWHEQGVWFWSRCDGCGDEMSREEYDVNARRWLAFERARLEVPRLASLAA
jgi:hypothetical protein